MRITNIRPRALPTSKVSARFAKVAPVLLVALSISCSRVDAVPTTWVNLIGVNGPYGEPSLQNIVDACGNTHVDISCADCQSANPAGWVAAGSLSVSLVAKHTNRADRLSFGVYNANDINERQAILSGSALAGETAGVDVLFDIFGFYLRNEQTGQIWYSDYSLNSKSSIEHLVTYQGQGDNLNIGASTVTWDSSSYLLGWEDTDNGDYDYNDVVVLVSNVKPHGVPEAASAMTLLAIGLGVLGVFGKMRSARG